MHFNNLNANYKLKKYFKLMMKIALIFTNVNKYPKNLKGNTV